MNALSMTDFVCLNVCRSRSIDLAIVDIRDAGDLLRAGAHARQPAVRRLALQDERVLRAHRRLDSIGQSELFGEPLDDRLRRIRDLQLVVGHRANARNPHRPFANRNDPFIGRAAG